MPKRLGRNASDEASVAPAAPATAKAKAKGKAKAPQVPGAPKLSKTDKVLNNMQAQIEKHEEMKAFVLAEMDVSSQSADQCFCICTKNNKAREASSLIHRNVNEMGGIALYHQEAWIRKKHIFKPATWTQMCNDQRQVVECFRWLTGYKSNTLIGVQCIPIVNCYELWDIQIDRWGVLTVYRNEMWRAEVFDTNFTFGPFGFIKDSEDATEVMELIHHSGGARTKLPFDLKIPIDTIGYGSDDFQIVKCSSDDSACVKGPGGLTFGIKKLFTQEQQDKIKTNHPAVMVQTRQDQEIALRPPVDKPDMQLLLKPKAVAKIAEHQQFGGVLIQNLQMMTHLNGVPVLHMVSEHPQAAGSRDPLPVQDAVQDGGHAGDKER